MKPPKDTFLDFKYHFLTAHFHESNERTFSTERVVRVRWELF